MNLSEISQVLDASISIDTRTLQVGDVFIAIQGDNFDGHQFLEQAKQAGAVAAIVSREVECDFPQILVEDTRIALGQIAAHHRQQFKIPVIALTGSSGKTSTKEMIASILRQKGEVLSNQGNFNNDIGAPLSLLRLTSEHDYAVFELGANHMHEIDYTAGLVKPDVALINNVGPAHIEGFGSEEGVAKAKGEIYQRLATDGVAIINADDQFASYWQGLIKQQQVYRFAVEQQADFTANDIQFDQQGHARFILQSPSGDIAIQLPVPGQHNVMNALAASACCFAVGIDLLAIKAGLEKAPDVPGRLISQRGLRGATIIDDTYNANPASVKAAIDVLSQLPGKRILVLGDMGELGDEAVHYHRQVGEVAKQFAIDACYTVGELSQAVGDGFKGPGEHFTDKQSLITTLQQQIDGDTVCLIKGSRSAKMEDIVAALTIK